MERCALLWDHNKAPFAPKLCSQANTFGTVLVKLCGIELAAPVAAETQLFGRIFSQTPPLEEVRSLREDNNEKQTKTRPRLHVDRIAVETRERVVNKPLVVPFVVTVLDHSSNLSSMWSRETVGLSLLVLLLLVEACVNCRNSKRAYSRVRQSSNLHPR